MVNFKQYDATAQAAAQQQYGERPHRMAYGGRLSDNLTQSVNGKRKMAALLLGIPVTSTAAEVKAAFRSIARTLHVDTGGAGGDMAALVAAKDLLLTTTVEKTTESPVEKVENTCPLCNGAGMVFAGFGSLRCEACRGTVDAL